jgi:hypothetical protein
VVEDFRVADLRRARVRPQVVVRQVARVARVDPVDREGWARAGPEAEDSRGWVLLRLRRTGARKRHSI